MRHRLSGEVPVMIQWNVTPILFNYITGLNVSIDVFFLSQPLMATGTVPYLGTFLTDLTMVDAAIKDTTPDGLINFEKKRKEFEILAQIRMLQAAAHTYRIKPEPAFFEWFHNVRVYDENERQVLVNIIHWCKIITSGCREMVSIRGLKNSCCDLLVDM